MSKSHQGKQPGFRPGKGPRPLKPEERHPIEQIRDRLWSLADEISPKARAASTTREVMEVDSARSQIIRRIRMWALEVVAGISDNYTLMADDGTLMSRVIGGYREFFGPGSEEQEHDEDFLYELNREVAEALQKIEGQEIFDEGVPVWASARAALQGLQQAILLPRCEDIRALAIQLSLVPEYMALSLAYTAISKGNEREGGDESDLAYFIDRERDPRIGLVIEGMRVDLGQKWLNELNRRLATEVTEDFEPPTGPSPGYGRNR